MTLYRLRRTPSSPPPTVLQSLKSIGILRYRGTRSRSFRVRPITTVITVRRPSIHHGVHNSGRGYPKCLGLPVESLEPRPRQLQVITLQSAAFNSSTPLRQTACTTTDINIGFTRPPSLYVINPTGLSKPHALSILQADLKNHDTDVALVAETWFKAHHKQTTTDIPDYTTYRRDRVGRRAGGVAVYIRSSVRSERCTELESLVYEVIWVKTLLNSSPLYIAAVYHPPPPRPLYTDSEFLVYVEQCLNSIASRPGQATVILGGDYNQLSDDDMCAFGLQNLVLQPTHLGNKLDRIYCTSPLYNNIKTVASIIKSKHNVIIARSDNCRIVDIHKTSIKHSVIRRSPSSDLKALTLIRDIDWSSFYLASSVQAASDIFYTHLASVLSDAFPKKVISITSRDPPFVTPHIKLMLRERNRLMRGGHSEQATSLSSKIGTEISKKNASRLSGAAFTGAGGRTDSALMWRMVGEVIGGTKRPDSAIPTALTAESLNQYYASVSHDPLNTAPLPKSSCAAFPSSDPFPTPWAVHNAISASKTNAVGRDGVPPWLSRLLSPFISEPLSHLFSLSLTQSVIPDQWKCAIITPVPKTPSPILAPDFRPISVLPLFSTILEKMVVRHFLYPLFASPPLSSLLADQYAFRPTGSTTAAIIALIHHITALLTSEPYVHVITLDFSKAFDVARHSSLFSKPACLPLPGPIYMWLRNFFLDRSHVTRFNSSVSTPQLINASIVQGSALGPVMFILNSTDLRCCTPGNSAYKYADDVTLVVPASNSSSIPLELANINDWCKLNNQSLNLSKTAELIITRRHSRSTLAPPPLLPGVKRVDNLNLLGVILDSQLSFSPHVTRTVNLAAQTLYALKTLKDCGLPYPFLSIVLRSTLVARLAYASPCWWGPLSAQDKDRLQKPLNRATRWGLYSSPPLSLSALLDHADSTLFQSTRSNPLHVLFPLLPPPRPCHYNMRVRNHNFSLTLRDSFTPFNFLQRMLF